MKRQYLLALIFCFANITYADPPSGFSNIAMSSKASNCGVDVTCFALAFFGREYNIDDIPPELGTNVNWDKPISLLSIENTLTSSGLVVSAYKEALIQELQAQLSSGAKQIAILHLAGTTDSLSHFVILTKKKNGKFLYIDTGVMSKEFADSAEIPELKSFDGTFLNVRDREVSTFVLDGNPISISAGALTRGPGTIQFPVRLKNVSSSSIKLVHTLGSCSCFISASEKEHDDRSLGAGETGTFFLKFNRDGMGLGNVTKEIMFSFEGLPQKWIKFTVEATMTGENTAAAVNWYPQSVNWPSRSSKSFSPIKQLSLFLPKDVKIISYSSKDSQIKIEPLASDDGKVETDEAGRTIERYIIDIRDAQGSSANDELRFKTTSEAIPVIVVPVTRY